MVTPRRPPARRTQTHDTSPFSLPAEIPDMLMETLRLLLDQLNQAMMSRHPELIAQLPQQSPKEMEMRRMPSTRTPSQMRASLAGTKMWVTRGMRIVSCCTRTLTAAVCRTAANRTATQRSQACQRDHKPPTAAQQQQPLDVMGTTSAAHHELSADTRGTASAAPQDGPTHVRGTASAAPQGGTTHARRTASVAPLGRPTDTKGTASAAPQGGPPHTRGPPARHLKAGHCLPSFHATGCQHRRQSPPHITGQAWHHPAKVTIASLLGQAASARHYQGLLLPLSSALQAPKTTATLQLLQQQHLVP